MPHEQEFIGTDPMGQLDAWLLERRHAGEVVAIQSYYFANRVLIVGYYIERSLHEVRHKATGT